MKKILLVGVVPYGYKNDLVKSYPDILFFEASEIGMSDSAFAMVELVKMMDGVMLLSEYKTTRLPWEILCTLENKPMYEKHNFPIEEEKPEVKQEAGNGD